MTETFSLAPGYAALCGELARQRRRYEEKARMFSIGRSVLGRSIWAAGVGDIRGSTLLAAGVGGQDAAATLLLIRFFDRLMDCMKRGKTIASIDVRRAMEGRSVMLLPCLNPDGAELALWGPQSAGGLSGLTERLTEDGWEGWQANARGVDLRLAFDGGWQAQGTPSAEGYAGDAPMTEPECRAAANFCKAFEVRRLLVFAPGEGGPRCRFGLAESAQGRLTAQVLANCCGGQAVGREASGSFADWFAQTLGKPALEVDIGCETDPDALLERFLEMMMLALVI